MSVTVVLPWQCLVPDNQRMGGMVGKLSKKYRVGKEMATVIAMGQIKGNRPRYTEPVTVELLFWLPDLRRRDPNNLLKLILDCLGKQESCPTGLAYADDSQIRSISWLVMGIDRDNPRVEVTVMPGTYKATWAKHHEEE